MTDNVLKYFSKSCGTRNRVFRYVKRYNLYFKLSFILLLTIPLYCWIDNPVGYKKALIILVVLFLHFVFSGHILSEKVKNILCKRYSLKSWKGMWNDSWEVKRILLNEDIEDVSNYLKLMKYEKCVPLIREDLVRRKQKYEKKLPLIPAMIGAIIVAEYNNYSAWDYSNSSDVLSIIGNHLTVIFIVTIIALSAKQLRDIYYEMVNLRRISNVDECLKVFEYLEMNNVSK